jgi:hypothetical protein
MRADERPHEPFGIEANNRDGNVERLQESAAPARPEYFKQQPRRHQTQKALGHEHAYPHARVNVKSVEGEEPAAINPTVRL